MNAPPERSDRAPDVGLGRLLRPVRGRLAVGGLLAAVSGGAGVVPFIAVAEVIKTFLASGTGDGTRVWTWVCIAVAAVVVRIVCYAVATVMCHYADADFRNTTRRAIVRALSVAPLGVFGELGSSEVKKAVTDDVSRMHVIVAHSVPDLAGAVAAPIVAAVYLGVVDWSMMLIVVGYVVVSFAATTPPMQATFRKHMGSYNDAVAETAKATVELVDGIEVVKAYGHGATTAGRFTAATDRLTALCRTWMKGTGVPVTVLTVLYSPAVLIVWIITTGSILMSFGVITAAQLVPFLAVGVGLPGPFMNLTQIIGAISSARVAAVHVGRMLGTEPLPVADDPRAPVDASVEFRGVEFSYDGQHSVLSGIDLSLPQGTVTALVGPSGSGKTTLARLIPRFWDVTGGSVLVGGVDVRDMDQQALLAHVAVVFQDAHVLRETVRENIRLGRPDASDTEVENAARAAYIHERIERLPDGYDTVLGSADAGLSGGEVQRVTIARAMLQDAPILVLDEATAHADPHSEAEIQRAISSLAEDRTVVVIAHRLHTIASADRIVVLDAGVIAESGTHTELLASDGRYAAMWTAQEVPA